MRFVSVLLVALTLGACAPSDGVVRRPARPDDAVAQPVQDHYGTRFLCTTNGKTYTITAKGNDYFVSTRDGFSISISNSDGPDLYLGIGLEYQCERHQIHSDQPIVPSIVVTE